MNKNIKFWAVAAAILWISCSGTTDDKQNDKAVSVTVVESTQSWDGNALPSYPQGTPKVTLLRITIPPKSKLDIHKHPIINVGYMTKGELIVTSESGEQLHLKEGDGIVEMVNKYHFGENPGNNTAEIIVFYAGDTESTLTEYKQ